MIIVAGAIEIDPADGPELEAAFDRMRTDTLAEEGCLFYEAYLGRTGAGTFFIFEKWRTPEELTAHFQTSHMAKFGAVLGGVGVRSMDVRKYEVSAEGEVP